VDPTPPVEGAQTSRGRYQSFTVRVWCPDESGAIAHGEVVHVATRRSMYFRDLRSMVAFIVRTLKSSKTKTDNDPDER
jgi:hypothetical protein